MSDNYHFSRPVELHEDDEYRQARLFRIDRRDAALTVNPAGNYVREVTDAPLSNWDQVFASAAVSVLSGVPGIPSVMLHGALVRSALRGEGRARNR